MALAWWRLLANLKEDERRRALSPKKKGGLFSGLFRRGNGGDEAPITREMVNFANRRSRKGNFGVDDAGTEQLLPDTDKKDARRATRLERLSEAPAGFVHRVESFALVFAQRLGRHTRRSRLGAASIEQGNGADARQ